MARGSLLTLPIAGCWVVMLIAAATRAEPVRDPSCGEMSVIVRAGALVYPLPHGFLRAGTDSIWSRRGRWRAGTDYALDRLRGELRLLREPVGGETLYVAACWLLDPPPLEHRVHSYRTEAPAGADSVSVRPTPTRPAAAHDPLSPPPGTALQLRGNKTIAVDFGSSQDAFLRQSLDLAVSGTLAPGVQLTGVLSDRNTPLTGGGSTQDLQSLDRVRIELTAPRGGATLGDLTLRLDEGEFARIERRLQGASATFNAAGFRSVVTAASAQGEYHRLQFYGIEGRQGPYLLTDRDGGLGISVVAASEVVTLDGARMTRGEGADYTMDYERARVSFSNRRLITSASRITVEYQFTLNRYRRNFAAAGTQWERGALHGFARMLSESDDRGRPLDLTFDASDRLALAAAGDSAARAIGPGVQPGGGDYDTVRVSASLLVFAYAGPDSGEFGVTFSRIGAGLGDYADSALVGGRTAYRYAGAGGGAFRVGHLLPLPESHQLWAAGAGGRLGALQLDTEGAWSRRDLNTFSTLDDRDNGGAAARARLRLEGHVPGATGWTGVLELRGRIVGRQFAPFGRLERPFEQENWGLPVGADLEHQRRVELAGELRPRFGGALRADVGRLTTTEDYRSLRRSADWSRDGRVATRASWERAESQRDGLRFGSGLRDHRRAELRLRTPWVEPALRVESDERRFASDTGRVGDRFRAAGVELQNPARQSWRGLAGFDVRRDASRGAAGLVDQSEARTGRVSLESPAGAAIGIALQLQRRDLRPLADPRRSRSDLGSVRLRAADAARGLKGRLDLELTSDGENRRTRNLQFVGAGAGAYDALGNFVGTGDYALVIAITPELERFARIATSGRTTWDFGASDAWRGSRVEFTFEAEARRRGDLRVSDVMLSPGASVGDPGLARGSVLQRIEADLAPASSAGAVRLRGERRVSADRAFENFAQTLDDRNASLRWRAREGPGVSTEVEASYRRQVAGQSLLAGPQFRRVLIDQGGTGQLILTPDQRLRAVLAAALNWSRPEGQADPTRTLRIGPDLSRTLGKRGRAELSVRRSFMAGPPAVSLLPSAEAAGAARWDGNSRLDYRVRDSTTLSVSFTVRDRPPIPVRYTGRAEVRAFF